MEARQSENPDDLTHSGPIPSDIETAESSSSLQNVETDTDELYNAAVEGKIEAFKKNNKKKSLHQLVTPNKNTILHIHITARPLDFVEGIPKLFRKRFPRAQKTTVSEKTWSEYFLEKIQELIDKLFPLAQKTAQLKKDSSLKFVEEILEMSPDLLWQVNIKEETLLHIAARHGHDDIVEFLLKKSKETHHNDQEKGVGAARQMLRMKNKAKDTALHEAVRFNHSHVVQRLIDEDPDYSYGANDAGETPLYLAAERGYFDAACEMILIYSGRINYGGPNGSTALHTAVLNNDLRMTWRIIFQECTLAQVKDEGGWIPLHYAAYYGYVDIVKELLDNDKSAAYIKTGNEKKTDIKTDNEERTALHIAASRGKVDIMKELISRCPGCSELVDERGWNVLHFAIESRNREAIKVVLENPSLGNLIKEYNGDGSTRLHQLATLGFYMPSFIGHPKVNKQAVNKPHLNAQDITSRKGLFSMGQEYFTINFGLHSHEDRQYGTIYNVSAQKFKLENFHSQNPQTASNGSEIFQINHRRFNSIVCIRTQFLSFPNQITRIQQYNWLDHNHPVSRYFLKDKGASSNDRDGNGSSSDDGKGKDKDDNNIANIVQEARQVHLVVAALIATVTFAAGVTVPGGYKNEGSPDQGTAILTRSAAFKAFIITDTIAMMLSSSAVLLHLFMAQEGDRENTIILLNHELGFTINALYSMVVAFITGTYAVLASSSAFAVVTSVVGCIFYAIYGHAALAQMRTFDRDLSLVNVQSMIPKISKAELDRVKREQIKRMRSQFFSNM